MCFNRELGVHRFGVAPAATCPPGSFRIFGRPGEVGDIDGTSGKAHGVARLGTTTAGDSVGVPVYGSGEGMARRAVARLGRVNRCFSRRTCR